MNLQNPYPPKPVPKDHREQQDLAQRRIRYFVGFAIASLIVLWLLSQFVLKDLLVPTTVIPYSDFKTKLVQGQIVKVTLNTENITGEMKNPDLQATGTVTVAFETAGSPASDPKVVEQLQGAGREMVSLASCVMSSTDLSRAVTFSGRSGKPAAALAQSL